MGSRLVIALGLLGAGVALAEPPPRAPLSAGAEVPAALAVDEAHALRIIVAHGFSRDAARERVEQLLDYWHSRFGVQVAWREYRVFLAGRVWGVPFRGSFEVRPAEVVALSTDPGLLFRGAALDYVRRKLQKYLDPQYREP